MTHGLIALAAMLALAGAAPAITGAASAAPRTERVQFAKGASSKTLTGSIKGYDGVTYLVGARAGQTLTVNYKPSNRSSYFNVTAPGAEAAMFVGSSQGDSFTTVIPSSGDYSVQVYLMRNAARRNEAARYTLTVSVK